MSKRKKSPQINLKKLSPDFIADLKNHNIVKNLQKSIDNAAISFEDACKQLSIFFKNSPSFKSIRTSSKSIMNDINKLSTKVLHKKANKATAEEKVVQMEEAIEIKAVQKDLSFCKDNDCSSIVENLKNANVSNAVYQSLEKVISPDALDCLKANEASAPTAIDTLYAFAATLKSAMETLFEKCNPFTQVNFASLNTKPLLEPIFDSVQAEYCSGENMPGECNTPHEFV